MLLADVWMGQFLPDSDVCDMSVQLPNYGLKLDVAGLRIWANTRHPPL
jgi:hypothetical protein